MTVATRLKHFLDFWKVNYMVFNHSPTAALSKAAGLVSIPPEQVITGTIILIPSQSSAVDLKPILCVHRLSDTIDLNYIATFYHVPTEKICLLSPEQSSQYFDDCEPGIVLPFGEPYHMASLIDSSIKQLPYVYFSGGGVTSIVRLSRDEFIYLTTQSRFVAFTQKSVEQHKITIPLDTDKNPKTGILSEGSLSNLPDYVTKIIEMGHLHASLDVFETHLRQRILFYPIFYPSTATKRDKFSVVSHVVTKTNHKPLFSMPIMGPFGLSAIWQDSLFSAELAQRLSRMVDVPNVSISCELAYLCGLFHHFGYLVYGHLYAPEFNLLTRQWQASDQTISISTLEKRMLTLGQDKRWVSAGHAKMGATLLSNWRLDSVIVSVAEHHHDLNYRGDGEEYVRLIYLVDQILAYFQRGDGVLPINENNLIYLGLKLEHSLEIASEILSQLGQESAIQSGLFPQNSAQ
jgi:prolyl-tRNA editing enzyme YbaK/EbsC (Cys-tRNA(Pro) deacylase)